MSSNGFIALLSDYYGGRAGPNGFITFLSDCSGGRVSDKYITIDSSFYNLLEQDAQVMADRAIQLKEKLLLQFCSPGVPPGS